MEKEFLLYLLYAELIGLRENSVQNGNNALFTLCQLIHNIPLQLKSEEGAIEAYDKLARDVEHYGMQEWLENRRREFFSRNPQYKTENS